MPATYEPIATTTLSSAAASITFSSIAGTYTDLRLVLVTRGAGGAAIRMRFNSDTGTNYSFTRLRGNGTAASSTRGTSQTYINSGNAILTAGIWGLYTYDIFSYAGSTNKTVLCESSEDENGSGQVLRLVNLWQNTAAITAIELSPASSTFDAGTTATLYGIKAA